jgi:hypothetical protein
MQHPQRNTVIPKPRGDPFLLQLDGFMLETSRQRQERILQGNLIKAAALRCNSRRFLGGR